MLILARRRGTSVFIGDTKVTVSAVRPPIAVLSVRGRNYVTRIGEKIAVDGGEVAVMSVNYSEVKLGFDFPDEVKIQREEIAGR